MRIFQQAENASGIGRGATLLLSLIDKVEATDKPLISDIGSLVLIARDRISGREAADDAINVMGPGRDRKRNY